MHCDLFHHNETFLVLYFKGGAKVFLVSCLLVDGTKVVLLVLLLGVANLENPKPLLSLAYLCLLSMSFKLLVPCSSFETFLVSSSTLLSRIGQLLHVMQVVCKSNLSLY